MNKIKELMKDKKKLFIIIGGVVVVILVVLLVVFALGHKSSNTESAQEKYERYLKEMGKDFWENYFYDTIKEDERNDILNKFQSIGIKANLDSLGRYNSESFKDKIAEFVNPKTNEACDPEGTKVIIYPKGNLGKYDYDLEVEIDCGFEEEN